MNSASRKVLSWFFSSNICGLLYFVHFILHQGHNLVIGNVGDSRAVMGTRDKDNKLVPVQLTVDLKPNLPSMLFFMKKILLYVAISFLFLKISSAR